MAYNYGWYGQLTGDDFSVGTNIIDLIKLDDGYYISDLAIQFEYDSSFLYDGSNNFYIEINGTKISPPDGKVLEYHNVNITSVKFPNATKYLTENTIITFAISKKGDN
jgi:hypothetical protein